MKKRNLKALLLLMLCSAILLFTGCATPTRIKFPDSGQNFISSNKEAIVFGRLEILLDGYPLPLNPSSLLVYSMTPYMKQQIGIGDMIFIDISPENGYFVAKLPPGKYIAGEITHRRKPGIHNLKYGYTEDYVYNGSQVVNILNDSLSDYPVVLVFEVFPMNATYLGTIQAINDRSLHIVKWEIKSEYARASEVFRTLYPNHMDPVEKSFEIKPCRQEKNENFFLTFLCLPIGNN